MTRPSLDPTWCPRMLMESEALAMSPDEFQSVLNGEGLLLVVGEPSDIEWDPARLLTLTGRGGRVQCFSK